MRALVSPLGSIAKAAKELEIPENTLRRACAGLNEPQAPLLIALSTKLGVSMSYLLGLTDDPTIAVSPGPAGDPQLEMTQLPNLDARFAAAIDERLAFPVWMLHRLAPADAKLSFLRARDDSMQPLFGDGALLLVNESETTTPSSTPATTGMSQPRDVFVFEQAGALRVKRLRRQGGDMLVMSENRAYDPEFLSGAAAKRIKIVGRVIWWDDRL